MNASETTLKSCRSCGGSGPFGPDKASKDGLKTYCKKCCADRQRAYAANNPHVWKQWAGVNAERLKAKDAARYAADPDGEKARVRSWQLQNPDKFRANAARANLKKYGITPEEKQALFTSQGGKCAICPTLLTSGRTGMQVDHDHATGRIRGLLCHPCNVMLGDFAEDRVRLEAAVRYLLRGPVELPLATRPAEAGKSGTRASNLWYKYGLTEETLQILRERQGGCAICVGPLGTGSGTHVDHDHQQGPKAVRGLLCRACNWGLGHARDSVQALQGAVAYLSG